MVEKILATVKESLGLDPESDSFNSELILFTNSVLADLFQLGVGPEAGLAITASSGDWEDLIPVPQDDPESAATQDARLNNVKVLVALKVRQVFDPPQQPNVSTALRDMIQEATWRVTVASDEIRNPIPEIPVAPSAMDVYYDEDGVPFYM